jgi:hypothetical protein
VIRFFYLGPIEPLAKPVDTENRTGPTPTLPNPTGSMVILPLVRAKAHHGYQEPNRNRRSPFLGRTCCGRLSAPMTHRKTGTDIVAHHKASGLTAPGLHL